MNINSICEHIAICVNSINYNQKVEVSVTADELKNLITMDIINKKHFIKFNKIHTGPVSIRFYATMLISNLYEDIIVDGNDVIIVVSKLDEK
ncbi:hypothetical protein M0R19_03320 [Candidatus Pacearchaeota archaeon]|jgi:hypothetical protein|nr:hypothetical protein [Candidatus Pacearchaeota archaeon]